MNVNHYIQGLKLADQNLASRRPQGLRSAGEGPRSIKRGASAPRDLKTAAVDVGSLLSFVEGVNPLERDDVLFSVQLAQRGASGAFDRFTRTPSWYAKYVEILEALGWTAEQLAFVKYEQNEGEVRMDKAALAIIMALATQNQLSVLREAVKAMEALSEEDDTIRLFDFHTTAKMSGNFQLGAVQKAANEALSMVMGAFHYTSTDARRKFLFFSWGAHEVEFWTAAQKMTLNVDHYARHRDSVKVKLGQKSEDYISELVLG